MLLSSSKNSSFFIVFIIIIIYRNPQVARRVLQGLPGARSQTEMGFIPAAGAGRIPSDAVQTLQEGS